MNLSGNIGNLLKLPLKIMFAIALACGLILFLPDYIIQRMYMINFRDEYGFTIGITFCISLSITCVSLAISVFDYCVRQYYKKMFIKKAPDRLKKLTNYQKAILYALYIENNHTESLPFNDGAVKLLEHNGYIVRTASMTFVYDPNSIEFPYTLQPWVLDELSNNQELRNDFNMAFSSY